MTTETTEEDMINVVRLAFEANKRNTNGRTFKLIPFNDIKLSTALDYVIKGLFPRQGLAVIWGPPKCGKSFWAFDAFMHVALGWKYRGRKVQQGPVVYCALEGGSGFARRVEAWRGQHLDGIEGNPLFFLLDVPLDLVREHAALIAAIRAALGGQKPVAVVIDTLNRALVGDENKSDDMSKFIRAGDMIRVAFDCLVAVIHHCGHEASRPRGHTSLAGADDVQIAVEKDDDGIITAKVEHMKDGEDGAVIVSRLEVVNLGPDDEGDPMSSCVIVPATAVAKGPKLSGPAKLALDQLQELIAAEGKVPAGTNHIPVATRVCSTELWRAYFYKAHPADKQDTKKKAFVRAAEKLQELKIIGLWGDNVWLAGQPGQAGTSEDLSR